MLSSFLKKFKQKKNNKDCQRSRENKFKLTNLAKCHYCSISEPHPKLARGESYSCGYKPYRCDLCKYSTTTKGNLSIHMQSDKHLHAVQEMPANMSLFLYFTFIYRAIEKKIIVAFKKCLFF